MDDQQVLEEVESYRR